MKVDANGVVQTEVPLPAALVAGGAMAPASAGPKNVILMVGDGMGFAQVPSGATVESPFGRLVLTVKQDGRTATVETLLEFTRDRVEPGEYADFREFLTAIDAALAQTFEGTR